MTAFSPVSFDTTLVKQLNNIGRILSIVGLLLMLISMFLPFDYVPGSSDFMGSLFSGLYYGYDELLFVILFTGPGGLFIIWLLLTQLWIPCKREISPSMAWYAIATLFFLHGVGLPLLAVIDVLTSKYVHTFNHLKIGYYVFYSSQLVTAVGLYYRLKGAKLFDRMLQSPPLP